MKKLHSGLALAAIALIAAACGTTSGAGAADAGTSSDAGATSPPVKQLVTAAAGGTVATADGKVKLLVPPGALAKDTEITVQQQPAQAGTAGAVYQFGPDGLQFVKPATLALQFDAKAAPAGKTASLATWVNGAWQPVAGSAVVGSAVSAPIAHFSGYAVIWTAGGAVPAACQAAISGFSACGGDPVGTWIELCQVSQQEGMTLVNPTTGKADASLDCPQGKTTYVDLGRETMTFAADGTVTTTQDFTAPTTTFSEASWPMTCFKGHPYAACTGFSSIRGVIPCTPSAGVCTCSGPNPLPGQPGAINNMSSTYSIKGNQLVDNYSHGTDYCITGDTLVMNISYPAKNGAGAQVYTTVYQRQK